MLLSQYIHFLLLPYFYLLLILPFDPPLLLPPLFLILLFNHLLPIWPLLRLIIAQPRNTKPLHQFHILLIIIIILWLIDLPQRFLLHLLINMLLVFLPLLFYLNAATIDLLSYLINYFSYKIFRNLYRRRNTYLLGLYRNNRYISFVLFSIRLIYYKLNIKLMMDFIILAGLLFNFTLMDLNIGKKSWLI